MSSHDYLSKYYLEFSNVLIVWSFCFWRRTTISSSSYTDHRSQQWCIQVCHCWLNYTRSKITARHLFCPLGGDPQEKDMCCTEKTVTVLLVTPRHWICLSAEVL
jgi:hypothetical protein